MLISLYQFVANKNVLHQFSNLISHWHKLSKVVDILLFQTGYLVEKGICLISNTNIFTFVSVVSIKLSKIK